MSNLEGLTFYGDYTLDDIISKNMITYMQYGLLQLGAYYNFTSGKMDHLGNDLSRVWPIAGANISGNTIYRGLTSDWIWEHGIDLKFSSGTQPIKTSGIYVNSTFYPTGTTISGTGYYLDYSRGQVVFDHSLPSGYVVQVPRSERAVHVYPKDGPEYRNVVYSWLNGSATGNITDYSYKAFLPSIFIDITKWDTIRGVHLGSRGKVTHAAIEFTIVSANAHEMKKLTDICYMLETKVISLYDVRNSPRPLDSYGRITNTGVIWPYLVGNYSMGEGRFTESFKMNKIRNTSLPIYQNRITIDLEFDSYPS